MTEIFEARGSESASVDDGTQKLISEVVDLALAAGQLAIGGEQRAGLNKELTELPGSKTENAGIDFKVEGDICKIEFPEREPTELEKAREQKDAREVTNILTDKGDFAYGYKRQRVREIFENVARDGGSKKVARLVDLINKQLKENGSDKRLGHDSKDAASIVTNDNLLLCELDSFKITLRKDKSIEDRMTISPARDQGLPDLIVE